MGGTSERGRGAPYLKFSLDLPNIKLDMEADPSTALPEVRRIVEALGNDLGEQTMPVEDLCELHLTDEFFRFAELESRVKNAVILDEDVRVLKRVIPFDREYDLSEGSAATRVNPATVKDSLKELFAPFRGATVRDCFVHIRGELDREQQCVIMDAIRHQLGMRVQPRFFSTRRNLEGNVLIEVVCFGEGLITVDG